MSESISSPIGKPAKHASLPQVLTNEDDELWFTRWGRNEIVEPAETADCNSCEDGTVHHFVNKETAQRVYCECDHCDYSIEFPPRNQLAQTGSERQ